VNTHERLELMARILVVEDDADVVSLIVRRLSKTGHRVQAAADSVEALALIEAKGLPEAVVLDVTLPGIDGLELLGLLRAQPGQSDLPAVFLSGRVEPEHVEAGRALGARYLTKPFVAAALVDAVDAVIAAAEAARRVGEDTGW
jgi:CheY-like chemotaxis protein